MSEEIREMHERLNKEITSFNLFVQVTNRTLQMMQQTDLLTTDNVKRLAQTMDDFTEQISIQQRQIQKILDLIRSVSPDKPRVPLEQSEPGQEIEQSDIIKCPLANDETDSNAPLPDDHDNDVNVSGSK